MAYRVVFIADPGGALSGSTDQIVESGADCSPVAAVPDEGHVFCYWFSDASGNANPLTVEGVTDNMVVRAMFARERTQGAVNALFWLDSGSPPWPALQRSDGLAYDLAAEVGWGEETGIPESYSVVTEGTRYLRLIRKPVFQGVLHVIHSDWVEVLTRTSQSFPGMSDALAPYLKWGLLAAMLSQDGPAHDSARAEYCRQRYEEGVAAAAALCGDDW